jgi:DNA mismatch repair protein MutS
VVFLYKVEPGPADRSFGIHVAKLAGVPKPVLERATDILHQLEKGTMKQAHEKQSLQPELFQEDVRL